MYCKNCGQPMNDNQAICLNCGVETGKGNKFCANCGNPVNENASVCLNCGVALNKGINGNGEYLAGKDKTTMALICFFLGGFGVHNFMMGETKKGIFKIAMTCCFGISIIFIIMDLVKILTDKYVIEPDKLI